MKKCFCRLFRWILWIKWLCRWN